jgi:mevalonate kinase
MDTHRLDLGVEAAWAELEQQRMCWVSREDEQIDGYVDMRELVRKILETTERDGMKASDILVEATKVSHRVGEGDIPDVVHAFLQQEIERLLALLRRARQALRSLDEISDEEITKLVYALDAKIQLEKSDENCS